MTEMFDHENQMKAMVIEGTSPHTVCVNGAELSPKQSLEVCNHSPTGFSWGYGGSGPAQLALAILILFVPCNEALRLHQDFKWEVIARIPGDHDFQLRGADVLNWIAAKKESEGG